MELAHESPLVSKEISYNSPLISRRKEHLRAILFKLLIIPATVHFRTIISGRREYLIALLP